MDSPLIRLPNTYRAFYGAFPALFPLQRQAIEPILQGKDLILQSQTGSGKTEAVLAPCFERVFLTKKTSRILYIVPTRALAFDLKRRLDPIITPRLGLSFGVRTGDIKRSGGHDPHLMITTPESLDVLLGSRNPDLREFVNEVGTVVIDEVHPFVYQYRGRQLSLLLERLERRTGKKVQKIALSATIADMDAIALFFKFKQDTVRIVEDVHKEIVPHLVHLKNEEEELIALFDDLYVSFAYRKILLFANSRSACDRLFAILDQHGRYHGACGLHYSNLKAETRRAVERRFRQSPHALCIATSTLELGIDVGNVDAVVLYEPPDSVSAFLQRIGRANRRQDKTIFWGICRGPGAGQQLVRFLALLTLARQGRVEMPLPKKLFSVLGQQTLSCVYEKRRISLPAMKELFPEENPELDSIFITMEKKGWLSKGPVKGLFQGGWRYTNCLFEYGIWSNFPETEEDYALVLSQKAIADIPRGVVAQLEPGDRVNLAGKRLRIIEIDHTKGGKRVLALPSTHSESKEIFWLGPGMQVSYEVAQSVRNILNTSNTLPENGQNGLFSRTRALLKKERGKVQNAVVLGNGIQVILSQNGFYRYLTYLGSAGNLILRWTVRNFLQTTREEEFYVASDAIGVDCSHWIDFTKLSLPIGKTDLALWAGQNLKMLMAAFPLNSFCSTLPEQFLILEMAESLFDKRVALAFVRYGRESSGIVSGNPDFPERAPRQEEDNSHRVIPMPTQNKPLLEEEKDRMAPIANCHPDTNDAGRPLTGSILAGYFRHGQCERFVRLHFVPPHIQPAISHPGKGPVEKNRIEHGIGFEETAMKHLEQMGAHVFSIRNRNSDGSYRSSKNRHSETITQLENLSNPADEGHPVSLYLSQGVLSAKTLFRDVGGIGVPDLIRISSESGRKTFEVGEIKGSASPQFHHKWQLAFYAFLLRKTIQSREITGPVTVSERGFLLLPSRKGREAPVTEYGFDLAPYLTAFPALVQNLEKALLINTQNAEFHLKSHCTHCQWYAHCYGEALRQMDIQFVPHLTTGQLDFLKEAGLKTIADTKRWLDTPGQSQTMPPHNEKKFKTRIAALSNNQILLKNPKTSLFPANISTSIIFLSGAGLSPFSETAGLLAVDQNDNVKETHTWETETGKGEKKATWNNFERTFLTTWKQSVANGKGPHIFSFGSGAKRLFLRWAADMATMETYNLLKEIVHSHWTDLRKVFQTHFALPVPGELTLFSLHHVLGLEPALKKPCTLFHRDDPANDLSDTLLCCENGRKWIMAHLSSIREKDGWETETEGNDRSRPYIRFVEKEQRLKRERIFSLQEYSLKERVDRFRAMGPLRFTGRELDHEGKFRYNLSMVDDHDPSKFREGDFLKLVPQGEQDLQNGFAVVLGRHDQTAQTVSVGSRQGPLALNHRFHYSLEEDATDFTTPKLLHAFKTVSARDGHPFYAFPRGAWERGNQQSATSNQGSFTQEKNSRWIRKWLSENGDTTGLNDRQRQAMELPFTFPMGLIDGPPGTGKTHLLGWILIALVLHAQASGNPVRIAVSALTHQAIDNVLRKVADLLNQLQWKAFPARLIKWGAPEDAPDDNSRYQVETCDDPEAIFNVRELILGATGYGLYRLFDSRNGHFPQYFDWIVLDEASQILVPQAALPLAYGKGKALFSGDIKQLPPIVLGHYTMEDAEQILPEEGADVQKSILEHLSQNCNPEQRVRLNITYRMNRELCQFPSDVWYNGILGSAPQIARSRLAVQGEMGNDIIDRLIDPERPVTLGILDHQKNYQQCEPENDIIARIACRMITHFKIHPDQIAIISPHRAQNNAISARLSGLLNYEGDAFPLIDTVERVQGAERDVIIFGFTTSDRDHVMSEFLNNPNRFNVVITRARKKLIVIGSRIFFSSIPNTEKGLQDNACFKKFYDHCKEHNSLFFM